MLLVFALVFIALGLCVTMPVKNDFTPRLYAPAYGNSYYYGDNVFYNSGYGMPNCTAYAWGRAYEILGEKPCLSTGDAGSWFEYNKKHKIYAYGKEPQVGAIACFDNVYGGHVAVVERIENNIITFSNSAYGGSNFYLTTASVSSENPGQSEWDFQGYIYLKDYHNTYKLNSSYKVVADSGVNLRQSPSLQGKVLNVIPKEEVVFIVKIDKSDYYNWGLTYYDGNIGYCALEYTESLT